MAATKGRCVLSRSTTGFMCVAARKRSQEVLVEDQFVGARAGKAFVERVSACLSTTAWEPYDGLLTLLISTDGRAKTRLYLLLKSRSARMSSHWQGGNRRLKRGRRLGGLDSVRRGSKVQCLECEESVMKIL